jgi:hypothetical protein
MRRIMAANVLNAATKERGSNHEWNPELETQQKKQ